MRSWIPHLKWVFLALFLASSTAICIYEWTYAIPMRKCENHGGWWSARYHECDAPIKIVDIPGYKAGKASASSSAPVSTASAGKP